MVKRKEFKTSDVENKDRELDVEEDEIIELEEVVEEPEFLPVGEEDLDELLKSGDTDFDFDIDRLDEELGTKVEDKLMEDGNQEAIEEDLFKTEPQEEKPLEDKPSVSSPTQEAIDELFKEALLEAKSVDVDKSVPTSKLIDEPKAIASQIVDKASSVLSKQELDRAIEELENRIMAKFEAFVQNRLPVIVLEAVHTELKALLKELEEQ